MNIIRFRKMVKFVIINALLIFIVFACQQILNFLTYDLRGPLSKILNNSVVLYQNKDFIRAIGWYVVQIIITYILIKFLLRKNLKSVGFNNLNHTMTIKFIKVFIIIFPLVVIIIWTIIYLFLGLDTLISPYQGRDIIYAVKDLLVFGTLPGLSEEPFFRVFIIQFLLVFYYKNSNLQNPKIKWQLIILSSIYFMLGHVFIEFNPLSFNFNIIQLISALLLGIFYSITYIKTKSIIAAIICHSYSDLIMFLFGYILYFNV